MFLSGRELCVSKMLIKEYRIPLPMSVEEYRIAQLYMIQVSNILLPARSGGSLWAGGELLQDQKLYIWVLLFAYKEVAGKVTQTSISDLLPLLLKLENSVWPTVPVETLSLILEGIKL